MNIKEIALHVAKEAFCCQFTPLPVPENRIYAFAEALIAEIAKGNEPVAEVDYGTVSFCNDVMWNRFNDLANGTKLYALPPTASQIEQETVEAWISVDERLPEVGFYLAWVKDDSNKFGGMQMILDYGPFAFIDDIYSATPHPDADEDGMIQRAGWHYERDSEGEFDSLMFDMNGKVTHWMPLPTPPKRSMEGV